MRVRSVARRLAVTLPFFSTAAVVLGLIGNPTIPETSLTDSSPSLILIVTTESLHPAFRALEVWNQVQGCPSDVVSLDLASDRQTVVSRLASLCRRRGATGLLLGGNVNVVPRLSAHDSRDPEPKSSAAGPRILPVPNPARDLLPKGIALARAPVGDLAEAWAFVDACRISGRTLDQLMDASTGESMALRLEEDESPVMVSWPLLSALAQPAP